MATDDDDLSVNTEIEMTEENRRALADLAAALETEGDEVEGFGFGGEPSYEQLTIKIMMMPIAEIDVKIDIMFPGGPTDSGPEIPGKPKPWP